MKIALLLSGHLRDIAGSIAALRAIREALDCDVFVHTWKARDMHAATWRQPEFAGEVLSDIDLVDAELRPIDTIVEDDAVAPLAAFYGTDFGGERRPTGAHFMIYAMDAVRRLAAAYAVRSGFAYDVAIRFRFDAICRDLDALHDDVAAVTTGERDVVMPAHNWATSLGAFFDGILITRFASNDEIMQSLPHRFDAACAAMRPGERFVPEMFIVDAIRATGHTIDAARGEYALIRQGARVEQIYRADVGRRERLLSELYVTDLVVRERRTNADTAVDRSWRAAVSAPRRAVLRILLPAYRLAIRLRPQRNT